MQRTTKFDTGSIKRNNHKVLVIWITVIAVIGFLGFMLLSPQGNTLSHKWFPNFDTPMDRIVKGKIITRVDEDSTVSTSKKTQFINMIKDVPLGQVTNAANNANAAATLYAQWYHQNKTTARSIIDVVYADSRLTKIREEIAGSHWITAANEYNNLTRKGNTIASIFKKAKHTANNSAKKLQQEASKIYNDSFTAGQ